MTPAFRPTVALFLAIAFVSNGPKDARAEDPPSVVLKKALASAASDDRRIEAIRMAKATGAEAVKVAEILVPLLGDKQAGVQDASQFMITMLGIDGAPAVVRGMRSKEPGVQNRSTQILAGMGVAAIPAMVGLLKDEDANVRLAAINIFVRYREESLVVPISEALSDSNQNVRRQSALYLSHMGKNVVPALPKVVPLLKESDNVLRKHAMHIIRHAGPDAAPELVKALTSGALKDADPGVQTMALNMMAPTPSGALPKEAIPMLLELSRSEHASLRIASMNGLAKLLPETTPRMRELMADSRPDIRLAAVNALQAAGPEAKALLPELVVAFDSGDLNLQNMAASTLMRIGAPAVPDVVKLSKDPKTRDRARQILENMSGDKPALVTALAEAGRGGEAAAVRAMRRLGGQAQTALAELVAHKNPEIKTAALDSLAGIGPITPDVLPDLDKYLKDPNPAIRGAAHRVYVRSIPHNQNDPKFVTTLVAALHDSDWEIRRTAGATLSRLPNDTVGVLVDLMRKSPSALIREEAIIALGFQGHRARSAAKPLMEVVRDPFELRLRKRALAALPKVEPNAKAIFTELLKDPDGGVRAEAVGSLKTEQMEVAAPALVALLSDKSDEVRLAAAKALSTLNPLAARDVAPLLVSENPDVRAAALHAVGRHESPATLKRHLSDEKPSVRDAAAACLAAHGSDAYRVLEEALRSKAFRTERAACNALVRMEDRPNDMIPILVELILSPDTEEPESLARAVLQINPVLGARHLDRNVKPAELVALLKREVVEIQELACLAARERASLPPEVVTILTHLVKDLQTPPNVLSAAAQALAAAGHALPADLPGRIVRSVHEKSYALREQALADFPAAELTGDAIETILVSCVLNQLAGETSEWTLLHANSNSTTGPAAPTFVRLLAIASGRDKRFTGRLTPQAHKALKDHFWRFLCKTDPGRRGIEMRPLPDFRAVPNVEWLSWATTAYVALDLLKDDPEYKSQTLLGQTPKEHFDEWTEWWREWARHRAFAGLWPEMGHEPQTLEHWPCLLNMADFASDAAVRQRFKMLLDLILIDDEQMSVQGMRGGQRGKNGTVDSPLDGFKDLLMARSPRLNEVSAGCRVAFLTSSYQAPAAAILLRATSRPSAEYEVANRLVGVARRTGHVTPHYVLGCENLHPLHNMEPHGYWRRLVFDDGAFVAFPLVESERRHVQHRNAYVATFNSADRAAVEISADLKVVEREGWIFASNGPAHVAVYVQGGCRFDKVDPRREGRRPVHSIYPSNPQSTVLLQASDAKTTGKFEEFQNRVLKSPLQANDQVLTYTGPGLPAIEFYRDNRFPLVGGTPAQPKGDAKVFDSPFLQAGFNEMAVAVRVGSYSAIYDFEQSRITEK